MKAEACSALEESVHDSKRLVALPSASCVLAQKGLAMFHVERRESARKEMGATTPQDSRVSNCG